MKTIILAPIIGYLAASGAATDWGPMCSKKYPSAVNAIGKFCQSQNRESWHPSRCEAVPSVC